MLRYWVPYSYMYLLNLAKIWALMLFPWVCQHLPSSLKCSYVSHKPPKKFEAWGPNRCQDIDSPTPQCIWLTWPRYGHWYSACGCETTSQVIWKCSYVSQKPPKKLGAWGPNRCWDIDFPTPLCICSTWPSYQIPMLHLWVCQHLPSGIKMFLCVSATSQNFGARGSNRCWDIDSPMYLLNLAKIWALMLCLWACKHLPSSL